MKSVSILGCGWMGLPWAEQLLSMGYKVKGTTTTPEKLSLLELKGIHAFLLKEENGAWDTHTLNELIDADIIYVFIPPGTRKSNHSNHASLIHQLTSLLKKKNNPPKIVYTSTTSVYAENKGLCSEEEVLRADDIGNAVVFQAEQWIVHSGIDYLILRLGGLSGGTRMLAKFFTGKKDLPLGNAPINMVHQQDVLGVLQFLLHQPVVNEIYNVCSPIHPTKEMFYTHLCERFSLEKPTYLKDENKGVRKVVEVSKLQSLGYEFKFPDPLLFTYDMD
jgi:nucleoside-diphosphate-sugar epimerase